MNLILKTLFRKIKSSGTLVELENEYASTSEVQRCGRSRAKVDIRGLPLTFDAALPQDGPRDHYHWLSACGVE